MANQRIAFIDYIRTIACFMVLLVHACELYYCSNGPGPDPGWYTYLATETDRLWVSLYDGFCRMSVPLFMIVSAYLLVPLSKKQTTMGFYKSRAKRILPPFAFVLLAYVAVPWLQSGYDAGTLLRETAGLMVNFPMTGGHLWFMYPLIGLYLFIPVISPWLEKATAREEQFFIGLFAVSTCMPYINRFIGYAWGDCDWNHFHMLWYFSGFLGYLVLAHYIRVHLTWSRAKKGAIGSLFTITGAVPTIIGFYMMTTPGEYVWTGDAEWAWGFCTPNVLLLTTGAFLLFSCIKNHSVPKVIDSVSGFSYGIYLMHLLILPHWGAFYMSFGIHTALAVPLTALTTLLTCWAVCGLASYIPCGHLINGVSGRPFHLSLFSTKPSN